MSHTTDKPKARLTAGTTTIPVGGSVTLICSVGSSDGWKYEWFRRTSDTPDVRINDEQKRVISVSQGGIYRCRGFRGEPAFYTQTSDDVTIMKICEFNDFLENMNNFSVITQKLCWKLQCCVFSNFPFLFLSQLFSCGGKSFQPGCCKTSTQVVSDIHWWEDHSDMWGPGRRNHSVDVWMENIPDNCTEDKR